MRYVIHKINGYVLNIEKKDGTNGSATLDRKRLDRDQVNFRY